MMVENLKMREMREKETELTILVFNSQFMIYYDLGQKHKWGLVYKKDLTFYSPVEHRDIWGHLGMQFNACGIFWIFWTFLIF